LNKSPTSWKILEEFGIKIWKSTRNTIEIKIVNKIFDISSIYVLFTNLKKFKNSIGKNKINKEPKKNIKAQKRLCPDQDVKLFVEYPKLSNIKYAENPSKQVPRVNKYKASIDLN